MLTIGVVHFDIAKADDFIVSDNLISLMLSQLSEKDFIIVLSED